MKKRQAKKIVANSHYLYDFDCENMFQIQAFSRHPNGLAKYAEILAWRLDWMYDNVESLKKLEKIKVFK